MQIDVNKPWNGQGEKKTSAVTVSQKAPCGFAAQRICNLFLSANNENRAKGLDEFRLSLERAIPNGYNIYLVPGRSLRLTDQNTQTIFFLELEKNGDGMPQAKVTHNKIERTYGMIELPELHTAFWKLCMEVSAVSEKVSLNPGPFIRGATLAELAEGPVKN